MRARLSFYEHAEGWTGTLLWPYRADWRDRYELELPYRDTMKAVDRIARRLAEKLGLEIVDGD